MIGELYLWAGVVLVLLILVAVVSDTGLLDIEINGVIFISVMIFSVMLVISTFMHEIDGTTAQTYFVVLSGIIFISGYATGRIEAE